MKCPVNVSWAPLGLLQAPSVYTEPKIDPSTRLSTPLSLKRPEPGMHAITNLATLSYPPFPALFIINPSLWA